MAENPDQVKEDLGASFRQSKREMWVMVATWIVFAAWVTGYCSQNAFASDGEGIPPLLLGMPRWVMFGVALPWLVANIFIFWFSMFFMKDTDLGQEPTNDSF